MKEKGAIPVCLAKVTWQPTETEGSLFATRRPFLGEREV